MNRTHQTFSAQEKDKVLREIENSRGSTRETLARLGISKSTYYGWKAAAEIGRGGAIADRKHAAQLLSCFAGAETPEGHQQDTGARAMHCASTFARKARRHRRTSQYAQLLYSRSL